MVYSYFRYNSNQNILNVLRMLKYLLDIFFFFLNCDGVKRVDSYLSMHLLCFERNSVIQLFFGTCLLPFLYEEMEYIKQQVLLVGCRNNQLSIIESLSCKLRMFMTHILVFCESMLLGSSVTSKVCFLYLVAHCLDADKFL